MLAWLGTAACLTGCVSTPVEDLTPTVETEELSTHVRFFAQPALRGRKPRTWGSASARHYIGERFKAFGLIPWGKARRFSQSFGLGTNMIGVLPGRDPNLAGEVVIVAAHYDHVGRTEKGLCRGACDNASGVAALLEVAEALSLRRERPRRSVCFAAFDCEETLTLGAFAFACRDDFDESSIVGVVNIDMLGGDAFAILNKCLFMTGTERFPGLRAQIRSGVPEGLTLLPLGTEIAGPRGDHVVFETLDRPVLFFTSGPYEDYHRPADTPDKLDYVSIRKSVDVIATAVDTMANSDDRYRPDRSDDGDIEELKAFETCLSKVRHGHKAMGWTEVQARRLDPVIEEIERLLGRPRYTKQDRLRLLRTAAQPLIPLALWPDSIGDPNDPNWPAGTGQREALIAQQTLYTEHRVPLVWAARELVKHSLSQRVSLLLGRRMADTVVVNDVPDHLIFLETMGPSQFRLELLFMTFAVGVSGNTRVSINCDFSPAQYTGTKDDLVDFCLLLCRRQVQRTADPTWLRVLRHVTDEAEETTYERALQSRLVSGGWPDERTWILDLAGSKNAELRRLALITLPRVLGREAEPMSLRVLADPNATAADRQAVILAMDRDSGADMLIAAAAILSDQTAIRHREQRDYEILTRPGTPFQGYPFLPFKLAALRKWLDANGKTPRTMSDLARERLRILTRQDFGIDTSAWRQWIENHWPIERTATSSPVALQP